MSNFGSGSFGSAVFGGDPTPYLYLQADAEVTYRARALMARGLSDGTSIRAREFSVGRGGFDPFDYLTALPVNPDAVALDDEILSNEAIDYFEYPNTMNACFYCLLESGEANQTLGEIGIWSEIQNSPIPAENGTYILSAIAHFPLVAKNSSMQVALRVAVQF